MTPERSKPIILMYHRIADLAVDPWGLAVAPECFAEHLAVLRLAREPLAMTDFVKRLKTGNLPPNAVAITFDDGYSDNLRAAKPPLGGAGISAMVFIATGSVGIAREFWWDELARLILGHPDDLDCDIPIGQGRYHLRLGPSSADPINVEHWADWRHPRTEREHAYLKLWGLLRRLPSSERRAAMSILRQILKGSPANPGNFPMTADEVMKLADGDLIEIGAHSINHAHLTSLSPDERRREIAVSKCHCELFTGRPALGFAYPYGDHDNDTRAAVRDAGFRFACSTTPQFVDVASFDPLALPRLQVRNWTAEVFERELSHQSPAE